MIDFNLHIKPAQKDVFLLTSRINDPKLIDDFKKAIDKGVKKKNNNYKTNVHGKMTSFKYFNKDNNFEKFISDLNPYFKKITNKNLQLIDSWGNILEGKDYVKVHEHAPNLVSGILYLSEGRGTFFHHYNFEVKSEPGVFVLFDSTIRHEVKQGYFNEKRYSLVFNFNMLSDYKELNQ